MNAPNKRYNVRAWQDTPGARDGGTLFGPFEDIAEAEQCVIVLAGRENIKSARIEEDSSGDV